MYTGWGANVQCVFCDFVIQNWKSGDTIKNKHPRAHCASAIRQKNRQHESTTTAEDSKASTSTTATAREISNQNSKGQNDVNVADYVPKEKYSKYRSIQKSTNSDRKWCSIVPKLLPFMQNTFLSIIPHTIYVLAKKIYEKTIYFHGNCNETE